MKYAVTMINGTRMYVIRQKTGNFTVVLPGDFLNITDQLSPQQLASAEQSLLKFERLGKNVVEELKKFSAIIEEMNKPTLTPFQALKALNEKPGTEEIIKDGFRYTLDAPNMCNDPSGFFPVAFKDDVEWFPSGDENDGITEGTYWIDPNYGSER